MRKEVLSVKFHQAVFFKNKGHGPGNIGDTYPGNKTINDMTAETSIEGILFTYAPKNTESSSFLVPWPNVAVCALGHDLPDLE